MSSGLPSIPQWLIPHYQTFQSLFLSSGMRAYRHAFDEALRHAHTNALAMRRDAFILSCLRERQMPTASLPWKIIVTQCPEGLKEEITTTCTQLIKAIKNFNQLRLCLLEALWYGRYGVQLVWKRVLHNGQWRTIIVDWLPVNGDKILYTIDGTPGIMIYAPAEQSLREKGANIIVNDLGRLLLLDTKYWRRHFAIHKHEVEDADYREADLAGGVYGVGLRHRIYWMDWLRREVLSWIVDYVQRVGSGFTVFYYEAGNEKSFQAAKDAATQMMKDNVVLWPRVPGMDNGAGIERVETQMTGADFLLKTVRDYFEHHIRNMICGQTLMARAATGLGSAQAFVDAQVDAKHAITKWDAASLDQTITDELLLPLIEYNWPGIEVKAEFVSCVVSPNPESALKTARMLYDMGIPLDCDEIRGAAGYSEPRQKEKTVVNPELLQQKLQTPENGMFENGEIRKDATQTITKDGEPQVSNPLSSRVPTPWIGIGVSGVNSGHSSPGPK